MPTIQTLNDKNALIRDTNKLQRRIANHVRLEGSLSNELKNEIKKLQNRQQKALGQMYRSPNQLKQQNNFNGMKFWKKVNTKNNSP